MKSGPMGLGTIAGNGKGVGDASHSYLESRSKDKPRLKPMLSVRGRDGVIGVSVIVRWPVR